MKHARKRKTSKLTRIRQAAGYAGQDVAHLLGCHSSYIALMETGRRRLTKRAATCYSMLLRVAKDFMKRQSVLEVLPRRPKRRK